jgi:hypothetical protein
MPTGLGLGVPVTWSGTRHEPPQPRIKSGMSTTTIQQRGALPTVRYQECSVRMCCLHSVRGPTSGCSRVNGTLAGPRARATAGRRWPSGGAAMGASQRSGGLGSDPAETRSQTRRAETRQCRAETRQCAVERTGDAQKVVTFPARTHVERVVCASHTSCLLAGQRTARRTAARYILAIDVQSNVISQQQKRYFFD